MSTPATTIYVCSGVLLTNDYLHTIWFDDSSAQLAYFQSKAVKTFTNYSYVRKSWSLKVESTLEQARSWNYLFFRNGTGKWYYYFITNVEYVNDHTVELFLEMDVMQTYLHEYTLHKCFVEREHSATDGVGDNILEEGLEVGEYITNEKTNVDMQELCVVVLSTVDLTKLTAQSTETIPAVGAMYDGVYSGLHAYSYPVGDEVSVNSFGLTFRYLDNLGASDAIIAMWMYPKNLLNTNDVEGSLFNDVTGCGTLSYLIERNSSVDGYTPRNKKLLTYPYNFMYVSNNAGGGATYHYEKFGDPSTCQLRIAGCLSPEGSTKLYPISYKDVIVNYDEGIIGASYPTCAWNQDVYKLWLAQNQNKQNVQMLTAGASIVGGTAMLLGGIATGGASALAGAGMLAGGVSSVANMLAERADREIQPPQSKGSYSAGLNVATEHQTFTIMKKSVDAYHAKILDQFFDLYGYKTHLVKVPNRKVRKNWTYTKTIGCHVSGNLCNEDLRKIQSIYDNGVTFWVNGDSIGDYGLSNTTL